MWFLPNKSHGESCEFMCARGSFVHQKCYKYALTNLLFGLCRSMCIIDLLVICPSLYPRALACPWHWSATSPRMYPNSLSFTIESIKEFRGVSTKTWRICLILSKCLSTLVIIWTFEQVHEQWLSAYMILCYQNTSSNAYYKIYLIIVDEMIIHHWIFIQDWHYVYVVEGWKQIPILLTLEQILSEGIVHNLTKMIIWQMCCKFGGILDIFKNFLTSSLILVQTRFQFF